MEKTQDDTRTHQKQGGTSNQKSHEGTTRPGMNDRNEKNPKPNTGMGTGMGQDDKKMRQDDGKMGRDDKKTADRPTTHSTTDDKRNSDRTYQKSDDKRASDQKRDDKRAADDMDDDDDNDRRRGSNPNKEEHKTESAGTKRNGSM